MEVNTMNGVMPLEKKGHPVAQLVGKDRQTRAETTGQDKVELSNQGRDITRFIELINAVPDVRQLRVEEVHSAIESGIYNVNAELVAQKIIGGDLLYEII